MKTGTSVDPQTLHDIGLLTICGLIIWMFLVLGAAIIEGELPL